MSKDKWTSGIIVTDGAGEAIHACLYECDDPTELIEPLKIELASEPEFGLIGISDKLTYRVMTAEELKVYSEMANNAHHVEGIDESPEGN